MRRILRKMTKNPYMGVFTGFLVTALIQSSSATTVMTVSFVNAGLLSLIESAGIIIGANIGTTVTGWVISAFGFSLSIYAICLPLMAFGVPLLFVKRDRYRFLGEVIIGFAVIFIALEMLKTTFPDAEQNANLLGFLKSYTDPSFLNLLVFMLVGMGITTILQSSSAAMVLTFVLCAQGWLPFHSGAAMVLGENIGTTITAEIAAVVGNVYAKRSARIHTLFNLIGAVWMLPLIPFMTQLIDQSMAVFSDSTPSNSSAAIPFGIAVFHTLFNLLNMVFLIGFVKGLGNLAARTLPSKGEEDEIYRLRTIQSMSETPELSILQVRTELAKFGEITSRMLGFTRNYLFNNDIEVEKKLYKRIKKYEKITDRFSLEIAEYLTRLSQGEISSKISNRIHGYKEIIGNLEECADIFFQMAKNIQRKKSNRIWFTPSQRNRLKEMFQLIHDAFTVMNKNISTKSPNEIDIETARELERSINKLKRDLRKKNMKDLEKQEFNIKSSVVYFSLFTACEKIGDQIVGVSEILVEEG